MLTGRGRYVDDVNLSGMLHAAFLRSPFPHADIKSVDVSAARKLPGVAAVFTGEDMQARTRPMRPGSAPAGYRYEPVFALARGKVRFVGDPVAIVVADSRYIAEETCELIEVDYDPLPAIATYDQALASDCATTCSTPLAPMWSTKPSVPAGTLMPPSLKQTMWSERRSSSIGLRKSQWRDTVASLSTTR